MEQPKVITEVIDQYMKMRLIKKTRADIDAKAHPNGELLFTAHAIIAEPECSWSIEERLDWLKNKAPLWDKEWLTKKMEDTLKNRIKVGISLLMAEWERLDYLENKRKNDSSTASNTGNPESDGAAAYPAE